MRWRCVDDKRVDGVPHTVAVPSVGSSRPTSSRTVVVLPQPLGPISPTMLPCAMFSWRPLTTRSSPNDLLNPLQNTADSPADTTSTNLPGAAPALPSVG